MTSHTTNAAEAAADTAMPADWNNAEVYGEDRAEWRALLGRTAALTPATKAAQKTFKSATEMTWSQWIEGGAGWGLSRHLEFRRKDGAALIFGQLIGDERKRKAVSTVEALVLDIDSGDDLDATREKIEELGLAAIIYSSFSDGARASSVDRDAVLRKLDLDRDPTDEELRDYLRQLGGKTEDHIASATITKLRDETSDGVRIVYRHAPIDKFRIVFPLGAALKITALAPTHVGALDVFGRKLMGLAEMVGVTADKSCTDPSRLFYTPRHPAGADPYIAVLRGRPISIDDVPEAGETRAQRNTGPILTPEGMNLKAWAAQGYAARFQVADLLEGECPERLRPGSSDTADKLTVECPFEHEHSTEGGTAAYVENAIARENGFAWRCLHNSCADRDRLDMLAGALAAEWFEELVLTEEGLHLLPDDEDEEEDHPEDEGEAPSGAPKDDPDWLPRGFQIDGPSIVFLDTSGDKTRRVPVCQTFEVVGRASNAAGDDHAGRIIAFRNGNGVDVEAAIDRSDLYVGDGREVLDRLARAEMAFHGRGPKWRGRMLDLLAGIKTNTRIPVVSRPGWQRDRAGTVTGFVTPTGEYLDAGRGGLTMRLHSSATVRDRAPRGDLTGWKVAAEAAVDHIDLNSYWLLGIAAGFAGPVLGLLGELPCGLFLSGETSKGKSVALRLAASVWAAPRDNRGVFHSLNSTQNALEDLASMGSEAVLCLDEVGAMQRPQDLGGVLFGLSSGSGKARKAGRGAGLAEGAEYAPFILLSNERGLAETITSAGKPGSYKAGLSTRFPDVDVTGGQTQGADTIAKLDHAKGNFGHAGPAFIRWLMAEGWIDKADDLKVRVSAAAAEIAGSTAKPATLRAARVFGIVQVAGELAADAGLISDREAISTAVSASFEAFLASDEGRATEGASSMLADFRAWLVRETGRGGIVPAQDAGDKSLRDVVGWYTADSYVLDAAALKELGKLGLSGKRDALLAALEAEGALERSGKNRRTTNSRARSNSATASTGRSRTTVSGAPN